VLACPVAVHKLDVVAYVGTLGLKPLDAAEKHLQELAEEHLYDLEFEFQPWTPGFQWLLGTFENRWSPERRWTIYETLARASLVVAEAVDVLPGR